MWGARGPFLLLAAMVGYGCVGCCWLLEANIKSAYCRNRNIVYGQAGRGCAMEAVLCHSWRQYHVLYGRYILLYLDRLLVVLIEGEWLCRGNSITAAGIDVIPPQVWKILSTPCCSHIG
jgi:hypothetical protein